MPSKVQILKPTERDALRSRLGLPQQRPLMLSVAAIDKSRKRLDYLIREVASLPEPRPAESQEQSKRYLRHQSVYNRFSWEKLWPDYIRLIESCKNSEISLDKSVYCLANQSSI